jgi:hypothetical protein
MQTWMKRSLLVLAVFGACWVAAVWYWRSTTRMPDTGELALAMLVMPLTLLSAMWLANKSFAAAPVAPAATAGTAGRAGAATATGAATEAATENAAAGAGAPAAAGQTGRAPAPWPGLGIAGAALRMPHGSSPAELAAVIAQGEARLDLDPELTDLQGFPLLAGRVAGFDTAPLEAWLAGQHPAGNRLPPHQLRAIALAGDVASTLAERAMPYSEACRLQLLPLAPHGWPEESQDIAVRWLVHCAASAGWPGERLARHPALHGAGQSPLAALQALASQPAGAAAAAMTLLVAFDSSIDQDMVEKIALGGKLYGPRNPNGRMPAEGAAGMLLQAPHDAGDAPRLLALSAAQSGQPATLAGLAQDALAQAGGAQAGYIAADTDHRAAAMSELMQCVESAAPGLDSGSALACLGAACGHTGAAGAIAAIALAYQQAAGNGSHALCLSNGDPSQRFALLVGPPPASSAPTLS